MSFGEVGILLAKVYNFSHLNFPDVIFYAEKRYVHMTLEGPAEDPNRPKAHKLEDLILIAESEISI